MLIEVTFHNGRKALINPASLIFITESDVDKGAKLHMRGLREPLRIMELPSYVAGQMGGAAREVGRE
jgi:hypothetical protein